MRDISEQLIKTKAELLCWGIKPNAASKQFYLEANPYASKKTGNVGLNLLVGNMLPAFVSTTHRFCEQSPYTLTKKNERWALCKKGKMCFDTGIIPMPKWYAKRTGDGTPMSDVFLHEGLKYLHNAYAGCGYFQTGEECRFCSTGAKWKWIKPENSAEVAVAAFGEDRRYEVCLGGGTTSGPDKSANWLAKHVVAIRRRVKEIPIWVEMVPPDTDSYIQMLIDAGTNAFCFNIEVWNDKLRKAICPGKSKVSKQRYFEAFAYVLDQLGPNKVNCILIAGLENRQSAVKGVEALARVGVKIDVMAFKPWDDCAFERRAPASPSDVLFISKKAAQFMHDYGVNPKRNHGCASCGACTVENHYWDIL